MKDEPHWRGVIELTGRRQSAVNEIADYLRGNGIEIDPAGWMAIDEILKRKFGPFEEESGR